MFDMTRAIHREVYIGERSGNLLIIGLEVYNMFPACRPCNSSKGNRLAGFEWFPSIERIMEYGREW